MKKENVISPISSPKDTTSTEKQKNDPLRNEKESESSPEEKEKQMTPDAVKEIHDPQSAASHNTLTKPHPLISALQASEDKLKLEVLELERIPLSISTLLPTIDWTRLRTLTLICCDDHEHLWRALRRKYAPRQRQSNDWRMGIGVEGASMRPIIRSELYICERIMSPRS